MYRIKPKLIERLRIEGYDLWTISLWETWLTKMPEFELAIQQIDAAFPRTPLGDGIGLREANAMDDYADRRERQKQRALDEKRDWRNISVEDLGLNDVSPCYFDAKGFHFHLPAFLIAELNDKLDICFINHLIDKRYTSSNWIGLLDASQASAIITILEVLRHHPDYYDQSDSFDQAISRIRQRTTASAG